MKKLILLSLLLITVTAQASAQFFVGAKAGLIVSTFTEVYMPTPHISYRAGVSGGYMLSPKLGIESGIYMKQIGIEDSEGYMPAIDRPSVDTRTHIPAVYFEMPLSLLYKISIAENVKIRFNGGIYAAYGSYGNGSYTYYPDGLNRSGTGLATFEDCYSSGDEGFIAPHTVEAANRLDYGLTFGIGIEAAGINVSANYDFGLANVYDVFYFHPESKNIKNRAYWIAVGYNFKL